MDTILFFALLLSAIGLIAVILMQSRGAGLGAAFGGDSSIYRSRRGIEKTLFQFTIVLAILFVAVCLVTFVVLG